jgi:glucosamine-6-phosphate deaminase
MTDKPTRVFKVEQSTVQIYPTPEEMGQAAAKQGAAKILSAVATYGTARIMIATGNSQQQMITALVRDPDLDWNRIEVFHMDEYVGLSPDHPASLRYWFGKNLLNSVTPAKLHLIRGEAKDSKGECQRYADLIRSAPINVCFLGIGENGHIAFNDPHVADFRDRETIKKVDLDDRSRSQQVKEGHFPDIASVPGEALTVTCPSLLAAESMICCVPESRKAPAVRDALEGPVTTFCPGSILRTHPQASIFLDGDSASLLRN